MRVSAIAAAAAFVLTSCSQSAQPVSSVSPSSASSAIAATSSPVASPSPCTPGSAYGLLIAGGSLQLITTCGTVQASASLAASSVHLCSPGGASAVLMPPVSASNSR